MHCPNLLENLLCCYWDEVSIKMQNFVVLSSPCRRISVLLILQLFLFFEQKGQMAVQFCPFEDQLIPGDLRASQLTLSSAAHLWWPIGPLTFTSLEVEPSHSAPRAHPQGFDRSTIFGLCSHLAIPVLPDPQVCGADLQQQTLHQAEGTSSVKISHCISSNAEALDLVVRYSVPSGSGSSTLWSFRF